MPLDTTGEAIFVLWVIQYAKWADDCAGLGIGLVFLAHNFDCPKVGDANVE